MQRRSPPYIQSSKKPPNWPEHVRFIQSACYHVSVLSEIRQYVQRPPPGVVHKESVTSTELKVVIRPITNPSHPAFGQFGLFANQKIPAKYHIIRYLGEIHCDERDSDYDLSLCRLPEGVSVGIDASIMGNQARFVNDYRGIASKPNAIFQDGRTQSGELCMGIWSCNQEIKKGEEILVSYGKSWWKGRIK